MGVFYYCCLLLEYLWQLKDQLVNEGELVLEMLVIDGDENIVLVLGDCYVQMCNVYFIFFVLVLKKWLEKCGFIDVCIVDVCVIIIEEQCCIEWMVIELLVDFFDLNDCSKMVEGYFVLQCVVLIVCKL